ncbi:hypothetical protein [Spirosoma endophyticum]|uniref:Uncharacterized protein n=1 Tax=Spirosoma endophyticum TaxID=662367 RepID=A0A1I2GBD5_9BACT|nr:hypothetical protein [Spirosoma endophyticum]SFF15064.1 hypothetical protein SAMN05216167_13125 [Spirosoma endophyticum]
MEAQYLLSAFEIAELLCRVKLKFDLEKEPISPITIKINQCINVDKRTPQPDQLEIFLGDCTRNYSEKFSANKLSEGNKPGQNKHPRLLDDMRIAVKDGMPMIFTKDQLRSLLNYLQIDFKTNSPYSSIEPRYLTEKQISFEGECWSIYYAGHDVKLQPRLTQGILEFKSYGEVRLKFNISSQGYEGKYRTYGKDEFYLLMELRSIPDKRKDLHILVYCGPGKPEIMLGQFHNVEQNIKAGLLFLDPIEGDYDTLVPKHINYDDKMYNQINPLIRQYFSEQASKRLFSPVEIVTYARLERYLEINKSNR